MVSAGVQEFVSGDLSLVSTYSIRVGVASLLFRYGVVTHVGRCVQGDAAHETIRSALAVLGACALGSWCAP